MVMQDYIFDGENYRVTFTDDGLYVEISGDDYIDEESIYGELSHDTKLIPYEHVSVSYYVFRTTAKSKPEYTGVIEIDSEGDLFDGDFLLRTNEKFFEAVKKYGVKAKNEEILNRTPPEKEKPKKVFRSYKNTALNYVLRTVIPMLVLAAVCVYVLYEKQNLWLLYVTGAAVFFAEFFALFSLASPTKLIIYENYLAYLRPHPVAFIDKTLVEKIDIVVGARGRKYIAMFTKAEFLEVNYSEKLIKCLKAELPAAEIEEMNVDKFFNEEILNH